MDDITDVQLAQYLFNQPGYQALSAQRQRLVIASYTFRSVRLVRMFDRRYQQSLSGFFGHGLSVYVGSDASEASEASKLQSTIEAHIPDTDEFSEQEASYAQNAFIALLYLMQAAVTDDTALLQRSIEMTLQNVDLLYYEHDPDYLQTALVVAEQHVLDNVLERVAATASTTPATLELIAALALPHSL